MSIGKNIARLREASDIRQTELAKAVNVSQSLICQIERGTKVPSLPLAKQIADCLGCDINDLLDGERWEPDD